SVTMNSSSIAAVVLVLLLCGPVSEGAISCSDVLKDLSPCVKYLQNGSGMPPAACCTGASTLASAATTSADKKTACGCIKAAAQQLNPNAQLAQALPGNCGITLPFTVSPNVDCSKCLSIYTFAFNFTVYHLFL
ncbi:Tryp_alpha_amyl domain-containing protein, partial [Cephalotus follicularis]